jgi:ATPase subunit of ABC transporter with duplicated ATPase domains
MKTLQDERKTLEKEMQEAKTEKKNIHDLLMKTQVRNKKSRQNGERKIKNGSIPRIMAGLMKASAEKHAGKATSNLSKKRADLKGRISEFATSYSPKPKFLLPADFNLTGTSVHITDGSVGHDKVILSGINILLGVRDILVIEGKNGTGKTTLAKAILGIGDVRRGGIWNTPNEAGYIDQHYSNLNSGQTVYEAIVSTAQNKIDVYFHLKDFLFRGDNEIHCAVKNLSGGEKARLSLAIAALTPKRLLVLDEITNNVDLRTKRYIAKILADYPAALIVISHETSFINEVCSKKNTICISTTEFQPAYH